MNLFCQEDSFREGLIQLINSSIVGLEKDELNDIYDFWKRTFNEDSLTSESPVKVVVNKKLVSPQQNISETSFLSGIDLPVWFGDIKSKKKVFIIGIDPLRNERTFNGFKADKNVDVVIGTPYAVHQKNARTKNTKHYWGLIDKLSAEGNFVYLTDIYKTFFYTDSTKKERSYNYFNRVAKTAEHIQLLKKELDLIKPDLILLFGAETFRQLFATKYAPRVTSELNNTIAYFGENKIPVLPMVHLSGSTRKNNILNFLGNNNVTYTNTKNYGQHYYDVIKPYL